MKKSREGQPVMVASKLGWSCHVGQEFDGETGELDIAVMIRAPDGKTRGMWIRVRGERIPETIDGDILCRVVADEALR